MHSEDYSLEDLSQMGWNLNPKTGIERKGYVSVSLCLTLDGHQLGCVPGYGVSRDQAIRDATAHAKLWMRRQSSDHPMYATLQDLAD
jgi:hypothetical protein